ncbi:MAG: DUF624 domain-containing protein [Oscillospiraceae bacterium]
MGLFSNNFNRPGPGVPKDAPKKKGLKRFFEILGRDLGDLFKLNLIFVACCVPMFAAGYFTVISFFLDEKLIFLGPILLGFALFLLASVLLGPALCGVHSVITNMLRDEPIYMWTTFKKSFKSNFRTAAPLGVVFAGLVGLEAFAIVFYFKGLIASGKQMNVFLMAVFFFNVLLLTLVSLYMFLQLVYLDLKVMPIIKNSLLLTFAMAKRTLPAGIWVMVCLALIILFFPVTIVLCILFMPILILLVADMWLWPTMEQMFHISDLLIERREKELAKNTQSE